MIQEPDGYSEERIMELVASLKQSDEGESRTPDVILILNETFCDLRQVADIHANQEFLHYWDTMPNTVKDMRSHRLTEAEQIVRNMNF